MSGLTDDDDDDDLGGARGFELATPMSLSGLAHRQSFGSAGPLTLNFKITFSTILLFYYSKNADVMFMHNLILLCFQ